VTPCSVTVGYQRFSWCSCLYLQEESKVLWNVVILPQHQMVSQTKDHDLDLHRSENLKSRIREVDVSVFDVQPLFWRDMPFGFQCLKKIFWCHSQFWSRNARNVKHCLQTNNLRILGQWTGARFQKLIIWRLVWPIWLKYQVKYFIGVANKFMS
jgi:hypothetical protein